VSLRINGRTAPTAQADGEPSHVFAAVASIDVVDLPRTRGGCFFGATLPGLTVPVPRARRSRVPVLEPPVVERRRSRPRLELVKTRAAR